LREAEHLPKHNLLRSRGRPVIFREVVVEPDLADGHNGRMHGEAAELSKLRAADRLAGRMRVSPDRGADPGSSLGQVDAGSVIGCVVADVDHRVDAGLTCLLQRLFNRERLPQEQKVSVRVDQATGSGFSIRGKSTLPSAVCVRGASLPHSRAVAQGALRSTRICGAIFAAVSGRNGEIK